jgi:Protein of unknown function (DUF1326)
VKRRHITDCPRDNVSIIFYQLSFLPSRAGVKELMIMDKGYCASSILFSIQDGSSNGIDLKGNEVVIALDFPGPTLFDGNATSRLYIDDVADTNQRKEG